MRGSDDAVGGAALITHAEALLFDLAARLRRVPIEEGTRRLHLRALALKRKIARWRDDPPEDDVRDAVLDEIEELGRQVAAWRRPRRAPPFAGKPPLAPPGWLSEPRSAR